MESAQRRPPLEGVRIIAIEQYGAGPFGSMYLADLGAEVIKIEDPGSGGDYGRAVVPYAWEGDSLFFQAFNRNKRSLGLHMRSAAGQRVFHDLVRVSDAVWNNLRGDLPAKLGLTYQTLGPVNPRIVTVSLSGFGLDGPRVRHPGYDYLAQALAGYMSVTGEPDDPPTRFGLSIVDFMSGATAALGLVVAVLAARQSGIGADVDVSLLEVAVANLNYLAIWHLNEGYLPQRLPDGAHPSLVPSQRFQTSDGYIYIMCNKEKFWGNLCDALGHPEWADDPRYRTFSDRYRHRDEVLAAVGAALRERPTAAWIEIFGDRVPCAPINTVAEALRDPQVRARGMVIEVPHERYGTLHETGCPIKIDAVPLPTRRAPALGEDTHAVLSEMLGYSAADISALQNEGAI
jgi:succinate---hydroxymethylglutarate CoA-transferase